MPKITSADLLATQNFPSADATDNSLIVTIDPAQPLPLGTYEFQLVVEDAAGNVSAPTRFKMQVVDTTAPNAIIDGVDRIPFRTAFTLSGRRSFDPDEGKIAKYAWTRIA
jgi:hypothetical protein